MQICGAKGSSRGRECVDVGAGRKIERGLFIYVSLEAYRHQSNQLAQWQFLYSKGAVWEGKGAKGKYVIPRARDEGTKE